MKHKDRRRSHDLSAEEGFGPVSSETAAASAAAGGMGETTATEGYEVSSGKYSGFGEERTAVGTQKCPACGDNLRFDPATGKRKCPSCGTEQDIFAAQSRELGLENLQRIGGDWANQTHVYHCNNCNAEDVMDRREIAHVCPFCGSPNVVEKEEFSAMRPNALLPFAIESKTAAEAARKWAKKRLFAPNDFKKYFKAENMKGAYLPAFTFDTQTFSSYSGMLGEYYYVTRRVNGKTVQERRTRYFPIGGTYNYFFDDLAVNATDAVPEKIMRTLLAYDYQNSVEYNDEFLYGFSALLYKRDGTMCWEDAKENARATLRSLILSQYHYDVVSSFVMNTSFSDVKYRYLLLPMYIGSYRYREKSYSFYVNGRNGKTKGKAPVSPFKVSLAVLAGAAIIALICTLVYFFS